jgi:hypothetical protein
MTQHQYGNTYICAGRGSNDMYWMLLTSGGWKGRGKGE